MSRSYRITEEPGTSIFRIPTRFLGEIHIVSWNILLRIPGDCVISQHLFQTTFHMQLTIKSILF